MPTFLHLYTSIQTVPFGFCHTQHNRNNALLRPNPTALEAGIRGLIVNWDQNGMLVTFENKIHSQFLRTFQRIVKFLTIRDHRIRNPQPFAYPLESAFLTPPPRR